MQNQNNEQHELGESQREAMGVLPRSDARDKMVAAIAWNTATDWFTDWKTVSYKELCERLEAKPTTNSLQRDRQFAKWSMDLDIERTGNRYVVRKLQTHEILQRAEERASKGIVWHKSDLYSDSFVYGLAQGLLEHLKAGQEGKHFQPIEFFKHGVIASYHQLTDLIEMSETVGEQFYPARCEVYEWVILKGVIGREKPTAIIENYPPKQVHNFFNITHDVVKEIVNKCLAKLVAKRVMLARECYEVTNRLGEVFYTNEEQTVYLMDLRMRGMAEVGNWEMFKFSKAEWAVYNLVWVNGLLKRQWVSAKRCHKLMYTQKMLELYVQRGIAKDPLNALVVERVKVSARNRLVKDTEKYEKAKVWVQGLFGDIAWDSALHGMCEVMVDKWVKVQREKEEAEMLSLKERLRLRQMI